MRIQRVMRHDITAAQVYEMSVEPAFQERKCVDAGALSWTVGVTGEPDARVVTTTRTLPTVGFPAMVRKLVPTGVTSTETITWSPPGPDGSRQAQLHVAFPHAPARMKGTIHVLPAGPDACEVRVDADFSASVPLIGKAVEKLAAPIILGVIESEERTGQAWVAERA